jgi:alkylation response protein AidB-like acyl-CoA dehydrogenase
MTAVSTVPASAEVISLADERASIRRRVLQRSARDVAEKAFARAGEYDEDGAYPAADVAALHESGLLTAVLPVKFGGLDSRVFASARFCNRSVRAACPWDGCSRGM